MSMKYLLLLTTFSLSSWLAAQESYQVELVQEGFYLADVAINADDEIAVMGYVNGEEWLIADYNPFDPEQNWMGIDKNDFSWHALHLVFSRLEWPSPNLLIAQTRVLSCSGNISIAGLNLNTGAYWEFCTSADIPAAMTVDEASNAYLIVKGLAASTLRLYKVSPEGSVLQQQVIEGLPSEVFTNASMDATYSSSTASIAVTGHLRTDSSSFVFSIDTAGAVLAAKQFEGVWLDKVVPDGEGGFYALGSTALHAGQSGNARDLALLRLDGALNIVSAQVFFADRFDYTRAELSLLPDGSIVLAYSTRGAYPVILAKLDADGRLLWQKGYPLYTPRIRVFSDGSLLLATRQHFDNDGRVFVKAIIAKTDPQGDIEGCETELTCLEQDSLLVLSSDLALSVQDGSPDLVPLEVEIRDESLQSQPFCDIPPPPSPRFELPATLCEGACLRLDSLPNRYADGISWAVRGPGVDTVWQDSLSFEYCFERPGEYEVEQSVWFLGCAYRHAQQLTVLDSLRASVSVPAAHVCDPPPVTISVSGSRPLTEVAWGDGPATAARPVLAGGTYAVTVSDGYCTAVAAGEVRFAQDSLDAELALALPADTAVCEQSLPFVLRPASAYTDTFYLDGGPGRSFELAAPGRYSVRAEILGCAYEQPFELGASDCRAKVYLPNAFSPNGDGVNDFLFPQGDDFELLELSVFDRWGGLVYRGAGPQARWDGTGVSGRPLPSGLYVVKLAYLGTRLGEREEVWGEATLVR